MIKHPKIKIAQVITRLDWGGSPDIYRILCEHLDPAVYDITLITGRTMHPTLKTKGFLERYRKRSIVIPSLKRDIDPVADFSAFLRLGDVFRKEGFDIVHTHTAKAGALGRLAARSAGKAVTVHTPHGHNFYGYFGSLASSAIIRAETFLAGFTDGIIALTELEKSDYIKFGVADKSKLRVIYQGLELEKFFCDWKEVSKLKIEFNIKPPDRVIGMIGRLEPVKGSGFFVDAASVIIKDFPDAKFLVVGEGSLKHGMQEKCRRLGLQDRMIFTGWREDIADILSLLDVLVLPSLNEAVGISLIEAQAMGVPVAATNVGGIPEVVKDKRTGILVKPHDAKEMASAVVSILSDKQRREAMSRAGKTWVRNKFSAEEMAAKTSEFYVELLNKKQYESRR